MATLRWTCHHGDCPNPHMASYSGVQTMPWWYCLWIISHYHVVVSEKQWCTFFSLQRPFHCECSLQNLDAQIFFRNKSFSDLWDHSWREWPAHQSLRRLSLGFLSALAQVNNLRWPCGGSSDVRMLTELKKRCHLGFSGKVSGHFSFIHPFGGLTSWNVYTYQRVKYGSYWSSSVGPQGTGIRIPDLSPCSGTF